MSHSKEKVEVITSIERRCRWNADEKRSIVGETCEPGKNVSQVTRKYSMFLSSFFQWSRSMEEAALKGVGSWLRRRSSAFEPSKGT